MGHVAKAHCHGVHQRLLHVRQRSKLSAELCTIRLSLLPGPVLGMVVVVMVLDEKHGPTHEHARHSIFDLLLVRRAEPPRRSVGRFVVCAHCGESSGKRAKARASLF